MNQTQTNLSGLRGAGVPFPLTLTLSLPAFATLRRGPAVLRVASKRSEDGGEREQPSPRFGFSAARPANPVAGFSLRRNTILPLPKGEGRGEGQASARR